MPFQISESVYNKIKPKADVIQKLLIVVIAGLIVVLGIMVTLWLKARSQKDCVCPAPGEGCSGGICSFGHS